ncbi:hypothetical protein SAMN02910384_00882 [Pseudobutyrivibrio sp. ACV-2]|uniref:hypothetical protein n=1 Tax=Pseudobutyrivibrio sp. ACV-2 TaxID=1520801 RepID=UPI0008985162|nr:hypothetical protein [Pseudobutyrivibrio sp. ACV-2]SEA10804.1 hypothetical protein SAMN02910384_00882 [Pseudobutyrivibrio sp. ACV-2]
MIVKNNKVYIFVHWVEITDNCIWVEDSEEAWGRRLQDSSKRYLRTNMHDIMTVAGYNLFEQIKVIEEAYLG